MKSSHTNGEQQLGELARFLEDHPSFTPVFSDDAVLCGFRVGTSCLSLDDVQELFFVPREQRLARFGVGAVSGKTVSNTGKPTWARQDSTNVRKRHTG